MLGSINLFNGGFTLLDLLALFGMLFFALGCLVSVVGLITSIVDYWRD